MKNCEPFKYLYCEKSNIVIHLVPLLAPRRLYFDHREFHFKMISHHEINQNDKKKKKKKKKDKAERMTHDWPSTRRNQAAGQRISHGRGGGQGGWRRERGEKIGRSRSNIDTPAVNTIFARAVINVELSAARGRANNIE